MALQKTFGNIVSFAADAKDLKERWIVILFTFRWNKNTFFQPEQFGKVVFPTRKLPGYARVCGTGRLTETAMMALQ